MKNIYALSVLLILGILSCSNENGTQEINRVTNDNSSINSNRVIELDYKEEYDQFVTRKRNALFLNSKFLFSDTISVKWEIDSLRLSDNTQYYRNRAFVRENENGKIYYFIYGVSIRNSKLKQFRMRSIKDDKVIDDICLLKEWQINENNYDYYIHGNIIEIFSVDEIGNRINKSIFQFIEGVIMDRTIIPKKLIRHPFRRPNIGDKVMLFDSYADKTITINNKKHKAFGEIEKFYGDGKSCPQYMMIRLINSGICDSELVQVDWLLNDYTDLYELLDDEFIRVQCMNDTETPVREPKYLRGWVYIEYSNQD